MFWKLFVASAMVAVCVGLGADERGTSTRSLDSSELYRIFGGQPIQNHCCETNPSCNGVANSCGDFKSKDVCEAGSAITVMAGNRAGCYTFKQGVNCNQSTTTHTCLQENDCVWDTTLNPAACVTGIPTTAAFAPDTCDPAC